MAKEIWSLTAEDSSETLGVPRPTFHPRKYHLPRQPREFHASSLLSFAVASNDRGISGSSRKRGLAAAPTSISTPTAACPSEEVESLRAEEQSPSDLALSSEKLASVMENISVTSISIPPSTGPVVEAAAEFSTSSCSPPSSFSRREGVVFEDPSGDAPIRGRYPIIGQ